jgi:NACalpha-BTF3-like transcription factor
MKSEINFELKKTLSFQNAGQNLESNQLVLYAPSYKSRKYTNKLKQLFFRASRSLEDNKKPVKEENKADKQKDEQNEEKKDIKSEDILLMLYSSSVDIDDVYDAFEQILLMGHCKIDGQIELKRQHLDAIDSEDVEKMLGVYLLDFLLSYWMNKLTGNY